MQKATPKIVRMAIKGEKEIDSKIPPSKINQQPPRGLVLPPGALIPPIVM